MIIKPSNMNWICVTYLDTWSNKLSYSKNNNSYSPNQNTEKTMKTTCKGCFLRSYSLSFVISFALLMFRKISQFLFLILRSELQKLNIHKFSDKIWTMFRINIFDIYNFITIIGSTSVLIDIY